MITTLVEDIRLHRPRIYNIEDIITEGGEIRITKQRDVSSPALAIGNFEEIIFKLCGSDLERLPCDLMHMMSYLTNVTLRAHSEYLLNHPCTWSTERTEYCINKLRDQLKKNKKLLPEPVKDATNKLLDNWVKNTKKILLENYDWRADFRVAAQKVYSYKENETDIDLYHDKKPKAEYTFCAATLKSALQS
ncbi:hypothetical protein V6N13_035705 [Hibiscus sabdariffa]|uniref:Uncharacterized protein n=1 Tax=Hibiscus sabdariffa TaxID=183260 RepID=A0ABR2S8J1_9ROSI